MRGLAALLAMAAMVLSPGPAVAQTEPMGEAARIAGFTQARSEFLQALQTRLKAFPDAAQKNWAELVGQWANQLRDAAPGLKGRLADVYFFEAPPSEAIAAAQRRDERLLADLDDFAERARKAKPGLRAALVTEHTLFLTRLRAESVRTAAEAPIGAGPSQYLLASQTASLEIAADLTEALLQHQQGRPSEATGLAGRLREQVAAMATAQQAAEQALAARDQFEALAARPGLSAPQRSQVAAALQALAFAEAWLALERPLLTTFSGYPAQIEAAAGDPRRLAKLLSDLVVQSDNLLADRDAQVLRNGVAMFGAE